jgi:hypothetical protein
MRGVAPSLYGGLNWSGLIRKVTLIRAPLMNVIKGQLAHGPGLLDHMSKINLTFSPLIKMFNHKILFLNKDTTE